MKKYNYNKYRTGMQVVKFFRDHAKITQQGQGNICITCEELWEMSDEEFNKIFRKDSK